jgi:putative PIN family toxin of toxin-antitoxin system
VSAFITPLSPPAQVIESWRNGRFAAVISQAILTEIHDVLLRPRIQHKYHYSIQQVDVFIQEISRKAQRVDITNSLKLCRDPQDDAILETAILGRASYVISRDEDLTRDTELRNRLQEFGVTPMTVRRFNELIAQPEADEGV